MKLVLVQSSRCQPNAHTVMHQDFHSVGTAISEEVCAVRLRHTEHRDHPGQNGLGTRTDARALRAGLFEFDCVSNAGAAPGFIAWPSTSSSSPSAFTRHASSRMRPIKKETAAAAMAVAHHSPEIRHPVSAKMLAAATILERVNVIAFLQRH